jgi:hypothetical protein
MVKGLGTVIYHVTDLNRAKAWYSRRSVRQPDRPHRESAFRFAEAISGACIMAPYADKTIVC